MLLSDLASLGSLVSGLAVLASLVYLAQQNRQTARNQRSVIHRTSAERLRNWAALTTQPSLVEVFPRFYDGDPSLTETELTACLIATYSNIAEFEDHFLQHALDSLTTPSTTRSCVSCAFNVQRWAGAPRSRYSAPRSPKSS